MPISFAEEFKVPQVIFDSTGVFNAILDVDTRVFIDPALLELTNAPEFIGSKEKVKKFFSGIITLLSHSKVNNDMYWKRADQMITFKELPGNCFGYAQNGTSGNAIGKVLRSKILATTKELIDEGEHDPALFELLGVFQENVGCDRVSDLLTYILQAEILRYSERISSMIDSKKVTLTYQHQKYEILKNPYNHEPLLLLPEVILSPLPVADSFDDIEFICYENQRVRSEINAYMDLGKRKKISKSEILYLMNVSKSFRNALIAAYNNFPSKPYDFKTDEAGEYIWYQTTKECVARNPLDLSGFKLQNIEDVLTITNKICMQFKSLIEDNGLHDLLYNGNKTPKHERAAQLLFFGIADAYCTANNIDLSREINNGRGFVDLKLSKGAEEKVIVEVKLTSNDQLKHGVEKQLPIYMQQEKTKKAIYLVIDNGHPRALKNFIKFYNNLETPIKNKIPYIIIDGTYKPSASNA